MMTRLFYSLTAVLFLLISCQSGTPAADTKDANATVVAPPDAAGNTAAVAKSFSGATAAPAVDYPMKPDTIKVIGKFIGCSPVPTKLKIAQHDELHAPWREVSVNANGEFTYPIYLTEPRRIAMRTERRASYDFIATTTEKTYEIEINCANGQERIELKDSKENVPYRLFVNANKKFREELDAAGKEQPLVFEQVKAIITEYHKTLDEIAAAHPGTFTATFFCTAEKLPEGSLASLEALRKNFLNREVFANPYLYNDFLGQRILNNYISIYDRNADQYDMLGGMLTIGSQNPNAAKRLQQITYNVFYTRHEEQLIIAYIKWAGANPELMQNAQVKGSLKRLEGVVPGNQIIDVQLQEPGGQIMKLSETVASAGKLVLLVFYSPTCDHCQHEIPQLKPLWEKYKGQGLKIYTVGFESTPSEWHNFIGTKASTEWVNTFEYNHSTPSGYDYKYVVNYTPTYIFISPQGKIVKRFPTFDDVKRDLPELME